MQLRGGINIKVLTETADTLKQMKDDEDVAELMAQKFYQRITGEIARSKTEIDLAEEDRFSHHHDIVYEHKVRLNALQTVLTSVIEDIEEEKVIEDVEEE